MTKNGKLVIFSAPSGAGKTTIVHHLLKKIPELEFSISATTREPRGDEQNKKDYYFISKEEFLHRIAKKQFVEFEEVYSGTFYGTLREEIERTAIRKYGVEFVSPYHGKSALYRNRR